MADIPEHLLKRSQERRKALGLPSDDEGDAPAPATDGGGDAPPAPPPPPPPTGGNGDAGASDNSGGDSGDAGDSRIPAHLLARSKKRRSTLAGDDTSNDAGGAGGGGGGGRTATAVMAPPVTGITGPGGHTQRLLTVVKSGSIQQTRAEAVDKVHAWPHLVVIEFASMLIVTAALTIFSALVRAPLLGLADVNRTPNPSKAPWYFLGLQELLTMFHPMVAGVTIPGVALGLIAMAPFIDKNSSIKPTDRKFAIAIFTLFLMMWAVLVIIGSFFRGPGFNFVFPWNDGIFFEL